MSHTAEWTCRSCRTVLGGVLRPIVAVASVDGPGIARLQCPGCGTVRLWVPGRHEAVREPGRR